MRFTRLGALQGDVIWKWISYFQRQSYITVILVVHDSNVSQTTYDLRLVNIKSSSRLEFVLINNKCPSSQIHLKTNIQAVAVSVTLHRTISICSIYIPPRSKIVEKDLDEIVNQVPTPFGRF